MSSVVSFLRAAQAELGYCRWDDPEAGTKYGRWYANLVGDSYFGRNGIAFCAMGASYVAYNEGIKQNGMPTASCAIIRNGAKAQGNWHSGRSSVHVGNLILFDWNGDGAPDHVGIVEAVMSTFVQTLEFNTTGPDGRSGSVARRTRSYDKVYGTVALAFDGQEVPLKLQLRVDGKWGCDTTRASQIVHGTYVDGVIDSQNAQWMPISRGLTTGWTWARRGYTGSNNVGAVQAWLNSQGYDCGIVDKLIGPKFHHAFIEWAMDHGSTGTENDSKLDYPSKAIMAYQQWLNQQLASR